MAPPEAGTPWDIARAEVFIETKIWISDYGSDATVHAFDKSADKLGVDGSTCCCCTNREQLHARAPRPPPGRDVRGARRQPDRGPPVLPADRRATRPRRARHRHPGLVAIGGVTSYGGADRRTFDDPMLLEIARQHGKFAAQVMLRWHLQEGRAAIPKSTRPARIAENFDVFDFELSSEQIAAVDALDTGVPGGPEPDSITLDDYGMPIPEA